MINQVNKGIIGKNKNVIVTKPITSEKGKFSSIKLKKKIELEN